MVAGRPRKYDEKIEEILELLAGGLTEREVAKRVGVGKSTIHRMRKTWRIVDGQESEVRGDRAGGVLDVGARVDGGDCSEADRDAG